MAKKKVASVEARAKRRGINLSKIARMDLSIDDAWAMYQQLDKFFKDHGIQHGSLYVEMSGYDGYLDGISVSASVTKKPEELEAEIQADDVAKAVAAEKAKKAQEKIDRKDYEEYIRLAEKFGNKK